MAEDFRDPESPVASDRADATWVKSRSTMFARCGALFMKAWCSAETVGP